MLSKFCLPLILFISIGSKGQFKNDNVLYKTVDPAELCATLEKNKGYILLDVRSPAEYADTSTFATYNLGHLKGARNIDVGQLGKRLPEIKQYKDQPVFVYCSHSQRSRRASKMLSDSGFTNIFNINGGMTAIYYTGAAEKDCLKQMVETGNSYEIISVNELCIRQMIKDRKVFILDVRSDSAFRHISRDPKENAMGTLRQSVNIPLDKLDARMGEIGKNADIVVVDIFGDQAAKAASLLKKNGYYNVSVLIEGVDRILYTNKQDLACMNQQYLSPLKYRTITASEYGKFINTLIYDYILLDVRTTEEFSNKHKDSWRNIGHIKDAVNIPVADINSRYTELDKNKEIIIYAFSSGKESFEAANALQKLGFTKLTMIYGGVFNMRWTAGNVKGQAYLKDFVVDIPEMNQ